MGIFSSGAQTAQKGASAFAFLRRVGIWNIIVLGSLLLSLSPAISQSFTEQKPRIFLDAVAQKIATADEQIATEIHRWDSQETIWDRIVSVINTLGALGAIFYFFILLMSLIDFLFPLTSGVVTFLVVLTIYVLILFQFGDTTPFSGVLDLGRMITDGITNQNATIQEAINSSNITIPREVIVNVR